MYVIVKSKSSIIFCSILTIFIGLCLYFGAVMYYILPLTDNLAKTIANSQIFSGKLESLSVLLILLVWLIPAVIATGCAKLIEYVVNNTNFK